MDKEYGGAENAGCGCRAGRGRETAEKRRAAPAGKSRSPALTYTMRSAVSAAGKEKSLTKTMRQERTD